jgi:hypothetical protein
MTETSAAPGLAEQQTMVTTFIGTVLNSGAEPLLKAQADLLDTAGTAVTDWLQRRQEAVMEAQRLVACLQAVRSPAEMLKAQQEWMTGAFQRLNADAAAYQASAVQLVEKSRHWVGKSVETGVDAPPRHANARPTGPKPVPVATKAQ